MSFMKSFSTSVSRAKQVAMVKIGQVDSTVDPQFDQLSAQFKEQYQKIKNFGKYVEKYQHSIKELGKAQKGMASMIVGQYDSSDSMYTIASHFHENITGQIETFRLRMEQHFNENFHQPLNQYLGQYKIIEERINERNTRLVDMDRYNADLKTLMSRPDTDASKLQIAKEKADYKRRDYHNLNEELVRDIPALLKDRARFFDGLFANLVQGNTQYLVDAAKTMGLLSPNFGQVNRTGVVAWPFVITEPSRSSHGGTKAKIPEGAPMRSQPQQVRPQTNTAQPQPMAQNPPQAVPARPQASTPSGVRQGKALFPFQGQDNSEISFQPGQIITIISQSGEWWVGEVNGQRGYFPSNYVQMI